QRHAQCWPPGIEAPPSDTFSALAAGGETVCGINEQQRVVCWSPRGGGSVPDSIPTGTFAALSVGGSNIQDAACGIRPNGDLLCWGADPMAPGPPPQTTGLSQVSVGNRGACALKTDGSAFCWGPLAPSAAPSGKFQRIAVGEAFACALDDGGK